MENGWCPKRIAPVHFHNITLRHKCYLVTIQTDNRWSLFYLAATGCHLIVGPFIVFTQPTLLTTHGRRETESDKQYLPDKIRARYLEVSLCFLTDDWGTGTGGSRRRVGSRYNTECLGHGTGRWQRPENRTSLNILNTHVIPPTEGTRRKAELLLCKARRHVMKAEV